MKHRIPSILLALSLAAGAFAADYVADVRFGPSDGDILTLPFDENREIHKAPDATMRYPMTFEDGQPVEYDECGIGLSLDLTEFECDGENVGYRCDLEMRELAGWKTCPEWRLPVFSVRGFLSTPDSVPRAGKLGEWMDFSGCGRDDTGLTPALRIRKADSKPEDDERRSPCQGLHSSSTPCASLARWRGRMPHLRKRGRTFYTGVAWLPGVRLPAAPVGRERGRKRGRARGYPKVEGIR